MKRIPPAAYVIVILALALVAWWLWSHNKSQQDVSEPTQEEVLNSLTASSSSATVPAAVVKQEIGSLSAPAATSTAPAGGQSAADKEQEDILKSLQAR